MYVPTASVPVLSAPDICGEVRARTVADELNDELRGVLAERLLHNVAPTEVTLNLLKRDFLQFRDVILATRLVPAHSNNVTHHNLVG